MEKLLSSMRFLQTMFLCLALVFSTICIVSCGDDDDDLKINDNTETPSEPTYETTDPTDEPSDIPMPEVVDLGLSVKWASCNLGASKPEEYGDYYGWGCIEPYTEREYVDWILYFLKLGSIGSQHGDCGTSKDPLRDYVYPNNKSIAGTQYDAAHVKLGGTWRMPTYDEIIELRDNTIVEWTTEKGVYGCKVTSKANGNNIFFPNAGYRYSSSLYKDGLSGICWSATPYLLIAGEVYNLYFYSVEYFVNFDWQYNYRCYGYSVRPVSE